MLGSRLTIHHRVLESLKAGKRLSETTFSILKVAPKGQKNVYGMFKKSNTTAPTGIQALISEN